MNLEKMTPEELVDSYVLPEELTTEEKRNDSHALLTERKRSMHSQSYLEQHYGKLLQLKIRMEDYIRQDQFDPAMNFAFFLKSYIEIQPKKKSEIAAEMGMHKTKLSQLLSGTRAPSDEIFIRLEFHSKHIISARDWLKIAAMEHESNIMSDISLRSRERKHVTGFVEI